MTGGSSPRTRHAAALFAGLGPGYERVGAIWSFGQDPRWRRFLVSQAGPGSRVLDGRFTGIQQAIGTPKGRDAGARYLREFVEEVKASGLVARLIEKHGVRGVSVAPLAPAR